MKNVLEFAQHKKQNQPITMVTCYDYTLARILENSDIDALLVGDSVAMTMHGYPDTLKATPELMALHIKAVRRGAPKKFIVGDMPFLAHRGSLDNTLSTVRTILQAGAQAIKIEGVHGHETTIAHIVESGVPVMGHLGLTPQFINTLGGFKVQGTNENAAKELLNQSQRLENLGCFALVLEGMPAHVAQHITKNISIPTIGIGAGPFTSGQILVLQDLLGLNLDFKPKFVRSYLEGGNLILEALNKFNRDVKDGTFPSPEECY